MRQLSEVKVFATFQLNIGEFGALANRLRLILSAPKVKHRTRIISSFKQRKNSAKFCAHDLIASLQDLCP